LEIVDLLDSGDTTNLALLTRPELGITFTKIHCWNLIQYRKCVFLDADTLVIQNCDELFERDELSAVPDIGWPDCFNSGVFVFEPSRVTYEALLEYAVQNGSFDGKNCLAQGRGGRGGSPLCGLYRYVRPQRVSFNISCFGLKIGIDFDLLGLK